MNPPIINPPKTDEQEELAVVFLTFPMVVTFMMMIIRPKVKIVYKVVWTFLNYRSREENKTCKHC